MYAHMHHTHYYILISPTSVPKSDVSPNLDTIQDMVLLLVTKLAVDRSMYVSSSIYIVLENDAKRKVSLT